MSSLRSGFYVNGYLVGPEANLSGADLSGADLTDADLTDAVLTRADLRGADLTGANLSGADLSGADRRADLTNADLSGADLSGADMKWARLKGADLSGTDLSGTDLSWTDLSWTDLSGTDLSGADLSGTDLSGVDLSGVDLRDADLRWTFLRDADLRWTFLRDADLTGADLFYADLRRADLTNADLTDAVLNSVRSGRIRGTPLAMPTGWELVNGHLFESSATTYKIASTNSSYQVDTDGSVSVNDSAPIECEHTIGETYTLTHVKDSDGNYHGGNKDFDTPDAYQYQGVIDVNGDGLYESIYTNQNSGRWVTASIDTLTGICDYSKYESGDTTRVVGVYEDPNVTTGTVEKGSPLDSSYTLQKDLELNNLILKGAGDYDGDGFQELYWSKMDNTAYCHMLMHADGNIQYANYQNLDQMTDYLTSHGFADMVALIAQLESKILMLSFQRVYFLLNI